LTALLIFNAVMSPPGVAVSAEVTARPVRLAAIVLGVLVLVLAGLSVPMGITARKPFPGLVLFGVLAAALAWLIIRRQPGNRIGLLGRIGHGLYRLGDGARRADHFLDGCRGLGDRR
jgi:hypothetical protein